ncbi:MAG TPA: glycerophosphodiester phosphodiesterase [Arthrobacter sp.]|nr:glycerophosphodiester phosphodiesterase [Arthrobacter sp.]
MSSASPYLNPTFPGSGQNRPLAMSHRGFSLAGQENSMAAFRAAVELGYRYLETDVRATRDGVLMAFHDPTLERTTDGRGELAAHTAGQLAQLRIAGEPIPTFEELLAAWPDVCLNVDVKDMTAADELARLIEAYGAHDRVLVASFSDRRRFRVLRGLRRPVAGSPGVYATAGIYLLGFVGMAKLLARLLRVHAVQVPVTYGRFTVVTPGFVRRCHRAGLQVHVWTINERSEMQRLLALGVDGLISDRADILADVMAERGNWPQRESA